MSGGTRARVALVGGFLGGGKTTAIAALARALRARGRTIAVVTNDQGIRLVDGAFVDCQGLDGKEVRGGCFCCRFDDYLSKLDGLLRDGPPDVVLCEPVGSCTDLVATVIGPLGRLARDRVELAPLSVVVDARRALSFLDPRSAALLGTELAYLFDRQVEEADLIVLTKTDIIPARDVDIASALLAARWPGKELLRVSSVDGSNVDTWARRLEAGADRPARGPVDVDYDTYARAEASLAWYDASFRLCAAKGFEPGAAVLALVDAVAGSAESAGLELVHLKVFARDGARWLKAGTTARGERPVAQGSMGDSCRDLGLILNARMRCEPALLRDAVNGAIRGFSRSADLEVRDLAFECFAPGRPVPRYRDATREEDG